ncbi:MAG TPA: XRE family transcriptional regulator [Acidobacteriaceae bacterium]|nr:XRE family transcriptional regulator [Acidobacteriaceae bacterium]
MSDSVLVRNESMGGPTQIDAHTAEQFIAEKHIGERIKRLRLKKSMGLVELGKHTGLSASFLSQLETGRVVPTLRNLARIAMVFSKDLPYFFESEPQALFRVHRQKDRVRLPQTGVDDPTYYFESLGFMVPDRMMDPYFAEFMPGRKPQEIRPHVHAGYEFLYVMQGELEIRHSDQTAQMESGDAVYFDASTPHAYICLSKTPAMALIVTMHQPPPAQPTMQLRPLGPAIPARGMPSSSATAGGAGQRNGGTQAAPPTPTTAPVQGNPR